MNKITWYHLQEGDEIKEDDEYFLDKLTTKWHRVLPMRIGTKYRAATMLPMRRRVVKDERE